MEIARLEAVIAGDVQPLIVALDKGEVALQQFATTGAQGLTVLNAGLSKTAIAAVSAATDIKSMNAALAVLEAEQGGIIKGSQLWFQYDAAIRSVNKDLTLLEAQLPVVASEMKVVGATSTTSLVGMGKGLTSALGGLRSIAYILPGIGIAGIFNLAFEAIMQAADALDLFNSQAKELADATDKAVEGYADEANKVAILVAELRDENTTRERKQKIINELQSTAPAYFGNLQLEGNAVKGLTDDYGKYGRAIILVAQIKAASDLNQKNVIADVQRQLTLTKALSDIQNNIGYTLRQNQKYLDPGKARLLALEQDLTAATKIAQASKPLLDIIIRAQAELNDLGGNPLDKPVKGITEVKKQLKEIEPLVTRLRALPFFDQIAIDFGNPLAPMERSLEKLPDLFAHLKQGSIDVDKTIAQMADHLGLIADAAHALGNAFGDVFKTLITEGQLSFKSIEQALVSLISKLIATVAEAAILAVILSAISGGALSFGGAFNSLLGLTKGIPHLAGGGIATSSTIANIGEAGPEAIIPLSQIGNLLGNMGGTQRIEVIGRISGNDIVLINNRQNLRNSRNYGNNFNNG